MSGVRVLQGALNRRLVTVINFLKRGFATLKPFLLRLLAVSEKSFSLFSFNSCISSKCLKSIWTTRTARWPVGCRFLSFAKVCKTWLWVLNHREWEACKSFTRFETKNPHELNPSKSVIAYEPHESAHLRHKIRQLSALGLIWQPRRKQRYKTSLLDSTPLSSFKERRKNSAKLYGQADSSWLASQLQSFWWSFCRQLPSI